MPDEVELIKKFAEMAFQRFEEAAKDLSEREIDWRPLEETNSLRWILTHLSQQWNVGIPRILKGDPEEKGKHSVIRGLEDLTPADLEAEIPLWGGTRKRQYGLLIYLSEIFHHVGQIAYLRGAIGRRRQTDEHFLT